MWAKPAEVTSEANWEQLLTLAKQLEELKERISEELKVPWVQKIGAKKLPKFLERHLLSLVARHRRLLLFPYALLLLQV